MHSTELPRVPQQRATRIRLLDIVSPQMRAFHMSWLAFFLCFFAWFGLAPLMQLVREEMSLTSQQVGWCIIGSVAATIAARLLIGWLCDRIGPRLAYSGLLMLGSLPVMGVALVQTFEAFLVLRIAIGGIGAAFVITQYHTSVMFAPNCVGTANATAAGWGNLGGGVTQLAMPLLVALLVGGFGLSDYWGWRASMVLVGAACLVMGILYFLFTQDTPAGNFSELRRRGELPSRRDQGGSFWRAAGNVRVWLLFVIYGACFGVELTINSVAALYFADYFGLGLKAAGVAAAAFGLMNLFARTLGGLISDWLGCRVGLRGRVLWLFAALLVEGIALMAFSQFTLLALAIPALVVFSLFVQMAEGATFSVVPFVDRSALGSVAGIVGAGGNVGAVAAGFLFMGTLAWPTALFILGAVVAVSSLSALAIRFSPAMEIEASRELAATRGEPRDVEAELAGAAG